ncbi:Zn(II)2Cys6 transcription factor domain-containing protein [Rhodotorula paludigena]|uniref:Zn(II)2Cys6 transcription factor domain-containing protein n=1 Tax=Rhodotorula paludigena TaxID=86838 RepID=UPI003181B7BE
MSVIASPPTAVGDDSAWHREGPVRMLQQGQWKRRNNPVACDMCRKRRVRCSGFETGAPCDACSRRGTDCVVGDDTYSPTAPTQTTIFTSVLPPPAVPCTSPCSSTSPSWILDTDALYDSLANIQPRPAPLSWKSPNETLATSTGSARLRQRRAVDYSEPLGSGHPRYGVGPAQAPSVSRKRSSPSDDSEAHESAADDAYIPPPDCSPRRLKRVKEATSVSPRLVRHVSLEADEASPSIMPLAVFCSSSKGLVQLEAYKRRPRGQAEREVFERSPRHHSLTLPRLPTSSARDEPLPPPLYSPSAAPPHWPASGSSTPASRRASLDSTESGSAGSTAATTVEDGSGCASERAPVGYSAEVGGGERTARVTTA